MDDVNAGITVPTLGYWRSKNCSAGSINCVNSKAFAKMVHRPTYNDNLVEVTSPISRLALAEQGM
jgi:hypothetical protein